MGQTETTQTEKLLDLPKDWRVLDKDDIETFFRFINKNITKEIKIKHNIPDGLAKIFVSSNNLSTRQFYGVHTEYSNIKIKQFPVIQVLK